MPLHGFSPEARGDLTNKCTHVHSLLSVDRPAGYTHVMAADPMDHAERIPGPSVVRFGFDVLDRVEQAVAMVKERLTRAVNALETAGIPHAVAGGNAVAAWVARIDPAAVRTTVDVDILIDRADLDRAKAALEGVGFVHSFTFGIHIFVDGPQGKAREAVHILFAGEPVKPSDPVAAPDLSATDLHEGYRIVDLDRLVTMKLTAFRLKDRVHLLDMIDVGLIDGRTVARLPAILRPRLEELLANPDG